MLQDLSQNQLEQALSWLANPDLLQPPDPLKHLNEVEWFLLTNLLEQLQAEKDHSPVH